MAREVAGEESQRLLENYYAHWRDEKGGQKGGKERMHESQGKLVLRKIGTRIRCILANVPCVSAVKCNIL